MFSELCNSLASYFLFEGSLRLSICFLAKCCFTPRVQNFELLLIDPILHALHVQNSSSRDLQHNKQNNLNCVYHLLSGFAWLLLHLLGLFNTARLTVLSAYLRLLSTETQFITFFNEILNLFSDRFLIPSKPIHYEATTVLAMWLTWFSVTLPRSFH